MKLNFTKKLEAAKVRVTTGNFPAWLSNMCVDSAQDYDAEVIALAAFEEGRLQVLEQMQEASKAKLAVGYYEFSVNDQGSRLDIQYQYDNEGKSVWGYKTAAEVVEWLDQQPVKESLQ